MMHFWQSYNKLLKLDQFLFLLLLRFEMHDFPPFITNAQSPESGPHLH